MQTFFISIIFFQIWSNSQISIDVDSSLIHHHNLYPLVPMMTPHWAINVLWPRILVLIAEARRLLWVILGSQRYASFLLTRKPVGPGPYFKMNLFIRKNLLFYFYLCTLNLMLSESLLFNCL